MLSQHRGPKKEDQLAEAIRILSNENVSDFVCETQLKVLCNMGIFQLKFIINCKLSLQKIEF